MELLDLVSRGLRWLWQAVLPDPKEPLKAIGSLTAIISALIGLATFWLTWGRPWWRAWRATRSLEEHAGAESYPLGTIERSARYYIEPYSQSLDPAGADEPRKVVTTREKLFSFLDRSISQPTQYHFLFLLADSGMGKTSALINYYVRHLHRWRRRRFQLRLIPLNVSDADDKIAAIPKQERRKTILFLDAFDEDTQAIEDHAKRIRLLLNETLNFHLVLISCRTQFFEKDEEILVDTGVLKVYDRAANERADYTFHKVYLSPFSDSEVSKYIKRRYPFWKVIRRRKAREIVDKMDNLSARPMLLTHIDEVINQGVKIRTTADIYEVMIEAWLEREKGFVKDKEELRRFSMLMANDLFIRSAERGGEHIFQNHLAALAEEWQIPLPQWQLRSRSLLNRDAHGNYKFAHRSIMEYLYVIHFLSLAPDERSWVSWTEQMKKFLVEIISYRSSRTDQEIRLDFADLSGCDFMRSRLVNIHFDRAKLNNSNFSSCSLSQCSFVNSDMEGVDFGNATLTSPDFTQANLFNADFGNATLMNPDFTGADLLNANLDKSTELSIKPDRVNITNTELEAKKSRGSNAYLIGKRLTRLINLPISMFSSDLAIDLGTANTLVFARGRGIVVSEPSIVAINKVTHKVEAVGNKAMEMLARTPGNIDAIRPIRDGVIADFEVTEKMLRYFIQQAHGGKRWVSPRIVIGIPSEITQVERSAMEDSAYRAGAFEVYLVEEAIAAAIGSGLPITEPHGNMIVNIGSKFTDIAVISLSGVVYSKSFRVASDEMDSSIIQYIKRKYNILISESTAEEIKTEIGSAAPLEEPKNMEIRGRNLIEGIPSTIVVTDEEIREALADSVATIVNAVRVALERTPPELSADIVDRGIVLTGGGSLLKKLDMRLMQETGLPVSMAEDPLSSIVLGAGMMLSDFDLLRRVTLAAGICT